MGFAQSFYQHLTLVCFIFNSSAAPIRAYQATRHFQVFSKRCQNYALETYHEQLILTRICLVKSCIDSGLGIRLTPSENGPVFDSWIPPQTHKKSFYVTDEKGEDVDVAGGTPNEFQFALLRPKMVWGTGNNSNAERSAKGLFTAEKWDWVTEPESGGTSGQFERCPRSPEPLLIGVQQVLESAHYEHAGNYEEMLY